MTMKEVSSVKVFGGNQLVYTHTSKEVKCDMKFAVYLPNTTEKCPVLFFLSGLTCTEQNVITKGFFQQKAAEHGIIVVCPDTSPRESNHPEEHDNWDFGSGAGFYLDATKAPWSDNYRMYSYVTKELPALIGENFEQADMSRMSITGHSMGGHGALISFLKNPGMYKSASAFSPICNPTKCAWGDKAFKGYLEGGVEEGKAYDACELIKSYPGPGAIMCDQGNKDGFYPHQLLSENLVDAAKGTNVSVNMRIQDGYDHSYYFISTFMPDHMDFHAKHLKN